VGKDHQMLVNSPESLLEAYKAFSNNQTEKYRDTLVRLGQPIPKNLEAEDYLTFVIKRTKVNPFDLITPQSAYLLETAQLMDSEMGLQLPGPYDQIPALFFDTVRALRAARGKMQRQKETDDGDKSNQHKGGLRKP
jgi:hypothetical protein